MPNIEFTTQEIEFLRKKYEKELEEGLKHVEYLRSILSKIRPARREIKFGEEKRKPGRPKKIKTETRVPEIIIPEKKSGKTTVAKPKAKAIRKKREIIAKGRKEIVPGARKRGRPKKIAIIENAMIPTPENIQIPEKSE